MPPLFHDESDRPFSIGSTGDGTLILSPSVVGKVLVSKAARNKSKAQMIRLNTFIDRGER